MQVQTIAVDGLTHQYKITVPQDVVEAEVQKRLDEIGKNLEVKGFRRGKVPRSIVSQRYGSAAEQEALEQLLDSQSQAALKDKELRSISRPKVAEVKFESGQQLEYTLTVEVFPTISMPDFAAIQLEKLVAVVAEAAIDKELAELAAEYGEFKPSTRQRTEAGDTVKMRFVGSRDGVPFEGGTAEDFTIEIGSGRFIPGFEDQLINRTVGETFSFPITFPADYGSAALAGAETEFEVTIKEILEKEAAVLDDAFAQKVGEPDLASLREGIAEDSAKDLDKFSRNHLKKELFDRLDAASDFLLPAFMVAEELANLKHTFAGQEGTEEKPSDEEAQKLANRRVKLGLLLAEIGRIQNIVIEQDDLRRVLTAEAQRYPRQAKQVIEFYQRNPSYLQRLTAPVLEDKVVDYILTQVTVTEKPVSAEELAALAEDVGNSLLPSAVAGDADDAVDHDAHTCNDPSYHHHH
jgi:trigger factor